jgi:DNA-binding protein HU-beta
MKTLSTPFAAIFLACFYVQSAFAFVHGPRGRVAQPETLSGFFSENSLMQKPRGPQTSLYAVAKKAKAAKKTKEGAETFKKADFITAVAEKTGMNKKDSEVAIQAVLDTVMEEVGAGKRVGLAGFGTFTLKDRSARKGRNPQTGEELDIAASKSPGFAPAKAWKDEVNGRGKSTATSA